MSLYGGMSKGERNRIKIRVRAAMAAQARTEGRYLGGRPPYGYQLADAGPHPNPGKAAAGQRLHRLELDPDAASVVRRIFDEYVAGRGLYAIAEGLTRDGIACPSARDRARNPHRQGLAWSKMAVRAILANPRYTGRQVWHRQRRDEVLLDVEDVALGHVTKLRCNDEDAWIVSEALTHEPLVSDEQFHAVRTLAAAGRRRPVVRQPRPTSQPFALHGLVVCALCHRRMQGSANHGRAHYRCRYPSEYAIANELDHPRNVYVREDQILGPLDGWLAQVFDPGQLDTTLDALEAAASSTDDAGQAKAQAARRRVIECDTRLARYRAALEAGTDPAVVSAWIAEVQAERRPDFGRVKRRARGRKSVSEGGLEPPRPCGHQPLKLARLPIPPLRLVGEHPAGRAVGAMLARRAPSPRHGLRTFPRRCGSRSPGAPASNLRRRPSPPGYVPQWPRAACGQGNPAERCRRYE